MSASIRAKHVSENRTESQNIDTITVRLDTTQGDPRFVKNKGLPAHDQGSYIPDDIIVALGQLPLPKESLAPVKSKALAVSGGPVKKPAANVWSHKRREKFKHLTDSTMCKCGAGRDISFLYDVPLPKKTISHPNKRDQSAVRDETQDSAEQMQLPRSLIPDEYHVVKNKGVMGLEYYDDDYTVYTENHEDHLVVFPSMKPSSRYEVMKLRQSMNDMLTKSGVNDKAVEVKGPTQMHNLLELIKKEQTIYNVIFHEVIRQCSVDCVERGELLSDLRSKYNALLSKVPIQVKGLHNEVLAQRALDRRLTEELLRFKSTISLLTNELMVVKAHDTKVTLEAKEAQEELKNALQEAARNASLLQEYHDLYELQRVRLEKCVDMLTEEKEMWCTTSYSLAIKVTEETCLGLARKLHVVEKSWTKLSNHFTILLSDQDTELITQLQDFVDKFRNKVADFNLALLQREDKMRNSVSIVENGIKKWIEDYKANFSKRDVVYPSLERQKEMLSEIHTWQELLSICAELELQTLQELAEKFVGDQTCSSEEELFQIRRLMDNWTDYAHKLFNRHRKEDSESNPNQETMIDINKDVVDLCSQYVIRLTGENGVAKGVILMLNMLETWETKLNLSIMGHNPVPDNHWSALQSMLEEWYLDMRMVSANIGRGVKDSDTSSGVKLDAHMIVRNVQRWATTSMTSIDSENAKLVEQVSLLHNEMVHWMIQMILRLAPNLEGSSDEINKVSLLASDTVVNLKTKAYKLFDRLNIFSKYISLCCDGIVRENVQHRIQRMDENPDLELKDLRRLRIECTEWVHTAKMLLCRLTGESEPEPLSQAISDDVLFLDMVRKTDKPVEEQEKREEEIVDAEEKVVKTVGLVTDIIVKEPSDDQDVRPSETDKKHLTISTVHDDTEDSASKRDSVDSRRSSKHKSDSMKGGEKKKKSDGKKHKGRKSRSKSTDTEVKEAKSESKLDEMDSAVTESKLEMDNNSRAHVVPLDEKPSDSTDSDMEKNVLIEPDNEEMMEYIGTDNNTHVATVPVEKPTDLKQHLSQLLPTSKLTRPVTPDTRKAFEALAAVNGLQEKLIETEQRAFLSEERVSAAEAMIIELQEELRALKREPNTDSSLLAATTISKLNMAPSEVTLSVSSLEQSVSPSIEVEVGMTEDELLDQEVSQVEVTAEEMAGEKKAREKKAATTANVDKATTDATASKLVKRKSAKK